MLLGSQSEGILKMLTVIKEHLGSLSSVQLELLELCLVFVVNFILKYNIRTKYIYTIKGHKLRVHVGGFSQDTCI